MRCSTAGTHALRARFQNPVPKIVVPSARTLPPFVPVCAAASRFLASGRGESGNARCGVRRVNSYSFDRDASRHDVIVYRTGYSWACLGALGRCAALRAPSPPRPHPGRARAPSHETHPTPHISPHAHRPTPTAARHSPQSHSVDKTQVTRTHTTSHHKVPHRCPRPGLVKAVRVPTLRVCIYQPSVQSTCPRPLPSHTALHESHCG